jgi:integrase
MPKLNKRTVDTTTKDAERDVFVWDSEVKGFGLKVTTTGAKSYVLQYRTAEGRSRRYSIGKHGSPWTCEEARERAKELLRGLAGGIDPLDAKSSAKDALTVKELAELYLAEGPAEKPNKKASSWKQDASQINRHIVPLFGKKFAKTLSAAEIARFQADVAAGKSATDEKTRPRGRAIVQGGRTIAARSVAVLGAMLQFAVGRRILAANPAKGVKLYKSEKRERFLSEREVAALADGLSQMEDESAINPSMAAAFRLLMLTGCRKGEIAGLQWQWVDFERSCLRLPRSQSKTGVKVVPLGAPALQLLSELPRKGECPYVLPAERGDGHVVGLQKAWEALRVRATDLARKNAKKRGEPVDQAPDLTALRLHDLRHSYASFAVADGSSLYMVGKVLGHKQTRTTEIYSHLRDDALRVVADRTAARIAAAMKGSGGKVVPMRRRRARA